MKRAKLLIIMSILLGVLTGCNSTEKNEAISLSETMDKIYKGIDMANMQQISITSENEIYYLGIDTLEYEEALASEPMISSIAHSVVLVQMKEGSDIAKAKELIKNNIDPRKWICVEVEKDNIIVENKGNLIILIMDNEVPQELLTNFKSI